MLVSGIFFEELGITYLGPVDGHNYDDLFENLQYAKKTKGPVLLHVITKKGRAISLLKPIKSALGTEQGRIKLKQATL